MAATMKALLCQWAPAELCGGMPHKGIHNVQVLYHDLDNSHHPGHGVVGVKADVRKYFDFVKVDTAVLEKAWSSGRSPAYFKPVLRFARAMVCSQRPFCTSTRDLFHVLVARLSREPSLTQFNDDS